VFNSWINKFLSPSGARDACGILRRKTGKRNMHRKRLSFESLETRNLLATVMVTNTTDVTDGMPRDTTKNIAELIADPGSDGTISLREAIMASNRTSGANVITFDRATSGIPIQLTEGRPLVINNSVAISGLGAGRTTVKAADSAPIFVVQTTYEDPGAVTLDGLMLTGCNGGGYGAIFAQFAYLTVSNSIIEGNDAGRVGAAGGINSMSHLTVINSTISGNSAPGGSGGIFAQGDLTIIDSTISGNSGYYGGIFGVDVNISNSTISNNSAGRSGGGFEARHSLTISNSTISGNSANYSGAGINVRRGASATISNSTISDNVGFGGGIFAEEMTILNISNSTIFGNSAGVGGYGGGIFTSGEVTVKSSIVAGNVYLEDGYSPDLYSDTGTSTVINSLIGDNTGSGLEPTLDGVLDVNGNLIGSPDALLDPLLGPLADNGGATRTMALLSGSPAIDRGANLSSLATDQRGPGFARVSGGRADIGAFEVQRSLFTPTVTVSNLGGIFNGNPFPAVATIAGEDGVATASLNVVTPTLTYYIGLRSEGPVLSGAPIHAGTYTVVADFAGSAEYSCASASTTFTIARATPILRTQPSLTIVLGSSANLSGQISLGALIPSGGVTITLGETNYFAAIQRDGMFSATLPAGTLAAGSYFVNYSYRGDTDFYSAGATQTLMVLSAQQEARLIINQVTALVTAGTLNNGTELTAKLDSAIASLNKGNTTAGVNQLSAFIKQVNAFVKSGKLTSADAHLLITEIDAGIAAVLASAV
jgi:hypothetical protein